MTVPARVRRLLRRLVASLPDDPDPWQGPRPQRNDLDDFEDFTDDEIGVLRQFLSESHLSPHDALAAVDDETLFDSESSDSDDEWDGDGQYTLPGVKIMHHPMRPPVRDFHLEEIGEEARLAFCELYQTSEFQNASCFREQVSVAVDYMRTDGLSIPFSQIATIFGVSKGTIAQQYQRGQAERRLVGRPSIVDQTLWNHVREFVAERFAAHSPATTEDVLEFISKCFGLSLYPDTLRCKLRQDPELRMITGYPLENDRVNCDPEEIQAFFERLKLRIGGLPSGFIFNLDESGFQDWADRRKRTVIVPGTYPEDEIAYPVDRATKRSSLLVCIAADGTYLKPMLILPRKTIEREVLEQGINEATCKLVYQEHGFISTALFEEWCWDVFFPEVQRRRGTSGYTGDAVLIMDGLTCHQSDGFEDGCLDSGVCIELLPAHSSDQLQPCDLGIFAAMKSSMSRVRPMPNMTRQSRQIVKILGALQATLIPPTVIHAFAQAGIHARYSSEHQCLTCVVDPSTARCVRRSEQDAEDTADSFEQGTRRARLQIA